MGIQFKSGLGFQVLDNTVWRYISNAETF